MQSDAADNAYIFERLTFRRLQILRLLADGRTEPEAARLLGIEPSTVHSSVDELRDLAMNTTDVTFTFDSMDDINAPITFTYIGAPQEVVRGEWVLRLEPA